MKKRLARRAGALTAMGALLLAGAITTAPSANAVGGSACTKNVKNHWRHIDVLNDNGWAATLRNGPGTNYKFKEGLGYAEDFIAYCGAYSRSGKFWYYVKRPSGKKGWVYGFRTAKGAW
ncbi:hypothetical protein [Streptomyces acidicola]|uniref:hypothetical protein n=1 Tax=Streptomyces acidicola TaxID=2596892 RepID=UPI00381D2FAF